MKLSVIMPVYNEKDTLSEIIEKVKKVKIEKEIIIVDDFSTDGSGEILDRLKDKEIKIFKHHRNRGKGAAIRTALEYVSGDIVIIQDADLEYDPNDYYKLIEPIINGKAQVVYGSRTLGRNRRSYWSFYWGGRLLSLVTNLLYRTHITDEPTCYKVFKTEVIKNIDLQCQGFEFCPEVTAKVCKKGYKIYEVPISYHPRSKEAGKKVSWKDGVKAIITLVKLRFSKG